MICLCADVLQRSELQRLFNAHKGKRDCLAKIVEEFPGSLNKGQIRLQLRRLGLHLKQSGAGKEQVICSLQLPRTFRISTFCVSGAQQLRTTCIVQGADQQHDSEASSCEGTDLFSDASTANSDSEPSSAQA